jgi:hypothetical protein
MLYPMSFESEAIRRTGWPQKKAETDRREMARATGMRFVREFAVARWVRSSRTQKRRCRAHRELSIGIRMNEIDIKITGVIRV